MDNSKINQNFYKDKYEMLKVIGKGGFGKVIMVKEKKSNKIFAMKILKKKYIGKLDYIRIIINLKYLN